MSTALIADFGAVQMAFTETHTGCLLCYPGKIKADTSSREQASEQAKLQEKNILWESFYLYTISPILSQNDRY